MGRCSFQVPPRAPLAIFPTALGGVAADWRSPPATWQQFQAPMATVILFGLVSSILLGMFVLVSLCPRLGSVARALPDFLHSEMRRA